MRASTNGVGCGAALGWRPNKQAQPILPELSGLKLKDIQTVRLARLLTKKREAGMSDKSRLNLYLLLSALFNYAVSLKLLKISPLSPRIAHDARKAKSLHLPPPKCRR
jgi:hypothetical protein